MFAGNESKAILICSIIGFIVGLVLGIVHGIRLGYYWLPFLAPLAGALAVVGLVFGAEEIVSNKSGIAKKLLGTFGGATWKTGQSGCLGILLGKWVAVLTLIIIAVVVSYFVIIALLAGLFILGWISAGKKLLLHSRRSKKPKNEVIPYSNESRDNDDWK